MSKHPNTRAQRRAQRLRVISNRRKKIKWLTEGKNPSESRVALGIAAKTPNRCSCWMCGNPRGHGHRTLAEISASNTLEQDLRDWTYEEWRLTPSSGQP